MLNVEKQKFKPNNTNLQSINYNQTTPRTTPRTTPHITPHTAPHITETGMNTTIKFNNSLKLSNADKSSSSISASLLDDKLYSNSFNDDIGDSGVIKNWS